MAILGERERRLSRRNFLRGFGFFVGVMGGRLLFPEKIRAGWPPGETGRKITEWKRKRQVITSITSSGNKKERKIPLAPVIRHGNRNLPFVALTMDDGWNPYQVEKVLDICKRKMIKMTFFPAGRVVRISPDIWKRAVNEGHEIGNHTFNHIWLTQLSKEAILDEIDRTQQALNEAVGQQIKIRFFRPPGMAGFTSGEGEPRLRAILAEKKLIVALWDVDSQSTRLYGKIDVRGVFNVVAACSQKGSIILQHFIPTDTGALPDIINTLKGRGLSLVTLSELMQVTSY